MALAQPENSENVSTRDIIRAAYLKNEKQAVVDLTEYLDFSTAPSPLLGLELHHRSVF